MSDRYIREPNKSLAIHLCVCSAQVFNPSAPTIDRVYNDHKRSWSSYSRVYSTRSFYYRAPRNYMPSNPSCAPMVGIGKQISFRDTFVYDRPVILVLVILVCNVELEAASHH